VAQQADRGDRLRVLSREAGKLERTTKTENDCSLDLHEAIQLLDLLFFTFEHADNSQDWFTMRAPIGSGIFAVARTLRRAADLMEIEHDAGAEGQLN
jgi:hypothetical protein